MNKLTLLLLGILLLLLNVVVVAGLQIEPQPGPAPSDPVVHDVTAWHAPELFHDHGADPATAHPMIRAAMNAYWTQEIGSPWLSSEHENMFPEGAHAGFTNLIENDLACENFRPVAGDLCVNAYFLQAHALGTVDHGRVDVHSVKLAALVCETAESDPETCGVVLTGGHNDYIKTHAPYIHYICEQPGDPVYPEQYQFQPAYVALPDRIAFPNHPEIARNRIFWSTLGPTPVIAGAVEDALGYLPNRIIQIAWGELDAWDQAVGFSPLCADPASDTRLCPDDVNDATCKWNGTEFSTFTILLRNLPSARPFSGFTDRHGNIQPPGVCAEQGVDCVPLFIGENVPQGTPALRRSVTATAGAPILNFDDGTLLRKPPFVLP
jgi:hypothetical protein